jgi:hypothetical protein
VRDGRRAGPEVADPKMADARDGRFCPILLKTLQAKFAGNILSCSGLSAIN